MKPVTSIASVRISPTASGAAPLPLAIALTLAVSSCATKEFPSDLDEKEEVCVVVENHHFNNVRVYAERDGFRHRLGTVEGLSTQVFRIPDRVLAGAWNFRLIADPMASSETVETHGLQKIPGCHTHWHLAPNIYASRVIIR